MWPWALNIKYTHATAVQTSEHCSFPNYSTQATATAQSIVVVVPSRIIPSSYPRITTPRSAEAGVCCTDFLLCMSCSFQQCNIRTADDGMHACRQITVHSSRFVVEGATKVLFSDILSSASPFVRAMSSAGFSMVSCPLDPWTHARALVTSCCSLQQRMMRSILAVFMRQCVYASEHLVSSERKLAAKTAN